MGTVPSLVITQSLLRAYENRAISLRTSNVRNQCDILCNQLVHDGYMENPDSDVISGKLDLLANMYLGRILVINKDFRIIKDTYNIDDGKTVISPDVIKCFQGENPSQYNDKSDLLQLAVPVKCPEAQDIEGVMLISISSSEISATIEILQKKGMLIQGIIIALVLVVGFLLSGILVKPFSRITKSIEALTDGYQDGEITVSDYT